MNIHDNPGNERNWSGDGGFRADPLVTANLSLLGIVQETDSARAQFVSAEEPDWSRAQTPDASENRKDKSNEVEPVPKPVQDPGLEEVLRELLKGSDAKSNDGKVLLERAIRYAKQLVPQAESRSIAGPPGAEAQAADVLRHLKQQVQEDMERLGYRIDNAEFDLLKASLLSHMSEYQNLTPEVRARVAAVVEQYTKGPDLKKLFEGTSPSTGPESLTLKGKDASLPEPLFQGPFDDPFNVDKSPQSRRGASNERATTVFDSKRLAENIARLASETTNSLTTKTDIEVFEKVTEIVKYEADPVLRKALNNMKIVTKDLPGFDSNLLVFHESEQIKVLSSDGQNFFTEKGKVPVDNCVFALQLEPGKDTLRQVLKGVGSLEMLLQKTTQTSPDATQYRNENLDLRVKELLSAERVVSAHSLLEPIVTRPSTTIEFGGRSYQLLELVEHSIRMKDASRAQLSEAERKQLDADLQNLKQLQRGILENDPVATSDLYKYLRLEIQRGHQSIERRAAVIEDSRLSGGRAVAYLIVAAAAADLWAKRNRPEPPPPIRGK